MTEEATAADAPLRPERERRAAYEAILQMCAHPGWGELKRELAHEMELIKVALLTAQDLRQVSLLQGQADQIQKMLYLEDLVYHELVAEAEETSEESA